MSAAVQEKIVSPPSLDRGIESRGRPTNLPQRQDSLLKDGQYRPNPLPIPNTTSPKLTEPNVRQVPSFRDIKNPSIQSQQSVDAVGSIGLGIYDQLFDPKRRIENQSPTYLYEDIPSPVPYQIGRKFAQGIQNFKIPEFDLPKFDLPEFDLPKFDLPKIKLPEVKIPEIPRIWHPERFPPPLPPPPPPKPLPRRILELDCTFAVAMAGTRIRDMSRPIPFTGDYQTISYNPGLDFFTSYYGQEITYGQSGGTGSYVESSNHSQLEFMVRPTDNVVKDGKLYSSYAFIIRKMSGDASDLFDKVHQMEVGALDNAGIAFIFGGQECLEKAKDPDPKPTPDPPPKDDCCRMGCCPSNEPVNYQLIQSLMKQTIESMKYTIDVPISTIKYFDKDDEYRVETKYVGVEVFATSMAQLDGIKQLHIENSKQQYELCAVLNNQEVEVYAAVPNSHQLRPESHSPQGIFQFSEILGKKRDGSIKYASPMYTITIPHINERKCKVKDSPLPNYTKGNWEIIYVLSDNSRITLHTLNESEGKKLLEACKSLVMPKYLQNSYLSKSCFAVREIPIKETKLSSRTCSYFSTGQKKIKPDWRIKYT